MRADHQRHQPDPDSRTLSAIGAIDAGGGLPAARARSSRCANLARGHGERVATGSGHARRTTAVNEQRGKRADNSRGHAGGGGPADRRTEARKRAHATILLAPICWVGWTKDPRSTRERYPASRTARSRCPRGMARWRSHNAPNPSSGHPAAKKRRPQIGATVSEAQFKNSSLPMPPRRLRVASAESRAPDPGSQRER